MRHGQISSYSLTRRVAIVGAGAFAQEVAEWIGFHQVGGFITDPDHTRNQEIDGLRIIAKTGDIGMLADMYDFLICVGDPMLKENFFRAILDAAGHAANFATFVHPLAYVASTAKISPGAIVGPFAVVGNHAVIEQHASLNYGAIVGHDATVGAFSVLSPQASIMGGAHLNTGCFMGVGARVIPRVQAQPWTKISAGAVLRKNACFPEPQTLYGDPAHPITKHHSV